MGGDLSNIANPARKIKLSAETAQEIYLPTPLSQGIGSNQAAIDSCSSAIRICLEHPITRSAVSLMSSVAPSDQRAT